MICFSTINDQCYHHLSPHRFALPFTGFTTQAIAGIVDDLLPEIKKASKDATVNRLVCGGCLDFKLMTTVPLVGSDLFDLSCCR